MTFLELCAGVGGFRLGLEQQGFSCVGYAEIEPNASLVYQSYFKDKRNFGDVLKIEPSTLPEFDMLVGGFPCQAFSIAGKKKGFNDERGNIFFEFERIIKSKRPKVLLFENVKGLLSHNGGRTFAYILASLCELGYSLQWGVFNSACFGLPQARQRVYIVGFFGARGGKELLFKPHDMRKMASPKLVATIGKGSQGGRVYDANTLACTLMANGGGLGAKTGLYATDKGIRRLTPLEAFRLQGLPDDMCTLAKSLGLSDTALYRLAGNAVSVPVVAYIAGLIKESLKEIK